MSILYRRGVLSGSAAAWSREITVGSELVEGGGWDGEGEGASRMLEPSQTAAEKLITSPTQHQHLPKADQPDTAVTKAAHTVPKQTY